MKDTLHRSAMRPNSWYAPHRRRQALIRRYRHVIAAALTMTALLMIAALWPRGDGLVPPTSPTRAMTTEPDTTPSPAGTNEPAPAQVAPNYTGWPVSPTLSPDEVAVTQPSLRIATRDDLIALYRWMIASGRNVVTLDSLTLAESDIQDITDKYSNYFDAYNYNASEPGITVLFKPGLRVLLAIKADAVNYLSGEEQAIARQAQQVLDSIIMPGMNDYEKELAIHDYMCAHCEYLIVPGDIPVSDARGFFQYGQCQCVGYCETFRLLGKLAGLDVEMVGGPTTRDLPGEKGHAWNLVRLDGQWYTLDVTWDDMLGGSTPEHAFFNLPDTAFGSSRTWDQSICPQGTYAARVDGYYYYGRQPYAAMDREAAFNGAAAQLDDGGSATVLFTGEDQAVALSGDLAVYTGKLINMGKVMDDLSIPLYRYTT